MDPRETLQYEGDFEQDRSSTGNLVNEAIDILNQHQKSEMIDHNPEQELQQLADLRLHTLE